MGARRAVLTDLPALASVFGSARSVPDRGVLASVLPVQYAACLGDLRLMLTGTLGLEPRARLFIEGQGAPRAAAVVHVARRPEWTLLFLAARPDPGGMDGAFRLVSAIAAAAAREGAQRLYAAVPDATAARETFFQAGFSSYTTETWFVARARVDARPLRDRAIRGVAGADAHDLFRLYAKTTPRAVQRAELLSVPDFDLGQGAGALAPPHLVEGNPFALRRRQALVVRDDGGIGGMFVGFDGTGAHPHVCKVRTDAGDTALARDLVRLGASSFGTERPVACPVRSYEDHVGRALEIEGFRAVGAAMLFVKELAVRVEEPALAPAVVR